MGVLLFIILFYFFWLGHLPPFPELSRTEQVCKRGEEGKKNSSCYNISVVLSWQSPSCMVAILMQSFSSPKSFCVLLWNLVSFLVMQLIIFIANYLLLPSPPQVFGQPLHKNFLFTVTSTSFISLDESPFQNNLHIHSWHPSATNRK